MPRLTPPAYLCRRCGKTGHWTNNCRSNNPYVKSSKGIPRSFMVPVDGPEHKGALLTSSGEYVVPLIDYQAYKVVKKEKPPFLPDDPVPEPKVKIPEEFLCVVCKDFLEDAVIIPCCGNSFCDECVRQILLDSPNHECPVCHDIDVSPDTLVPNRFLRTAVLKFKNKYGYTTVKTAAFVKQNVMLKNIETEKKVSNAELKSAETELTKINQNSQDVSQPGTPLHDEPADEEMFDNRPVEGINLEEYISNKENYEIGHDPVRQHFDSYNQDHKYRGFYDRPSRNSRNDPTWQHQDSYPPALSPIVYSLPNVSMPPEVYPAHPLPPGVSLIDTSNFSAQPSPPGVRPFLVSPLSNETNRFYTSHQHESKVLLKHPMKDERNLVNRLEAFQHDLYKQHREQNGDYISGSESGSSGFYGSSALSYSSKSSSHSLRRSLLGTPISRRSRSRSYSYSRSRSRSKTRTYSRTESRSRIGRYSRERVYSARHKTVHSRQERPNSREDIKSRRGKHKCKRHRALERRGERKHRCAEVVSNKALKTVSVVHPKLNLKEDFDDLNFEPDYDDFSDLEENEI